MNTTAETRAFPSPPIHRDSVGKPSRSAVREVSGTLGVPSRDIAVVGDDIDMGIALGHLGGSRTVLVRSGISSGDIAHAPAGRRPDLVVDSVGDLLSHL